MWMSFEHHRYAPSLVRLDLADLLRSESPLLRHITATSGAALDERTNLVYSKKLFYKPLTHSLQGLLRLHEAGGVEVHTMLVVGEGYLYQPEEIRLAALASELALLHLWPGKNSFMPPGTNGYADRLADACQLVLDFEQSWCRNTDIRPYRLGTNGDINKYLGNKTFLSDFGMNDFQHAVSRTLQDDEFSADINYYLTELSADPLSTIYTRHIYRNSIYDHLLMLHPDGTLHNIDPDTRAGEAADIATVLLATDINGMLDF